MVSEETLMLRGKLSEYLSSVPKIIGKKQGLGKNGICCFQHDTSGLEIVIELPGNSDILYFYSAICKVPYEHTEEFFEKLLENNLHGVANRQASFGLDAKTQNIVLTFSIAMRHVDAISFNNILNNFVNVAEKAREHTQKWIEEIIEAHALDSGNHYTANKHMVQA